MKPGNVSLRQLPFAPAVLGASVRSNAWLIAAAVALLTLSAKVQIPLWPVPFTMQTYVVLVIGMGYGARMGVLAVGSYILLGALGLPVFAGTPENGVGLPYMLGPTGGYLVGFVIAAWMCGWLAERGWDRRFSTCLLAMTLGHAAIFVCGVPWLATIVGVERAIALGFAPFIVATVLKTALAAISLPAAWSWKHRSH